MVQISVVSNFPLRTFLKSEWATYPVMFILVIILEHGSQNMLWLYIMTYKAKTEVNYIIE